jgi:hypothetical protein
VEPRTWWTRRRWTAKSRWKHNRGGNGPGGPGGPGGLDRYPHWAECVRTVEPPPLTEEGDGPVVIGDWSQSAAWWREALLRATQAYERWLMAAPMERRVVEPDVRDHGLGWSEEGRCWRESVRGWWRRGPWDPLRFCSQSSGSTSLGGWERE